MKTNRPNPHGIRIAPITRNGNPPESAYLRKIRALIESGSVPESGASEIHVAHDKNCALHLGIGKPCNCDPDVSVRAKR